MHKVLNKTKGITSYVIIINLLYQNSFQTTKIKDLIKIQQKFEKSKATNKNYLTLKIKLVQNKTNVVIYIDKSRLKTRASKEKFQLSKRVEIEVYFLQKLDTTNNYNQNLKKYITIASTILICRQLKRLNTNIQIFINN